MSQSMFEIRRVFQAQRAELSKVNEGQYSIANGVTELGMDQLVDNLNHMLAKEAGQFARGGVNLQHNPVDFLSENFGGKILPQVREEAVLSILQFAVQTQCLDQTVLQAVHLADNYLRFNHSCQPAFMRIIYAMALEISIKLNEQMVLSLEDIEALFEGRFNQKMLINLERHILSLNNFRVNVATPLDYVLNFVYLEQDLLNSGTFVLPPDQLVNDTLYLLHYGLSQYNLSRKKYSSMAVAAICLVLQDAHDDMQQANHQNGPDVDQFGNMYVSPMQAVRDAFLLKIIQRFPQLDMEEVYEILCEYKQPFISLAQQMDGQNEYSAVTEPWSFANLQTLINKQATNNAGVEQSNGQAAGLQMMQPTLPDMARLSLENQQQDGVEATGAKSCSRIHQQLNNGMGQRQTETDGDMVFSTADTSVQGTGRDPHHNLNMNSQSSMSVGANVEMNSAGGDNSSSRRGDPNDPRMIPSEYPPPELGRPSLSESTVGHSKNFSPQFDRMSSQTKNVMRRATDNEDLLDEDSSCRGFMSNTALVAQPNSVDGIFQIEQGFDPPPDDTSSSVQGDDDSEDELTFNSQGKPVPRTRAAADKKQSRKTITKPAKPKKEKKPGKPGEGGGKSSKHPGAAAASSLM